MRQGPRHPKFWNGYPISRTKVTINVLARGAWKALVSGSSRGKSIALGGHRALQSCYCFEESVCPRVPSSSGRVLVLPATCPAGAGKTYIASTVIDSLFSSPAPEKLAYFYCNRAEENRREPQSILNTLIQQLAQTKSENGLLKPVVDIYLDREKEGQKSSRLSLVESQELLVQLTDIYPQTTICIDA